MAPQIIKARNARVADIVAVASSMSRISVERILGRRRDRHTIRVRQACFVVARRCGHSYPRIGALMNRDHSSVVHGVKAAADHAVRDTEYAAFIEALDYRALNVAPFAAIPARITAAIPDKAEPPRPSLIPVPKKPEQRARNDFRSAEQPDGWQEMGDGIIAGSAMLAAAIAEARAA